MFCSQKSVTFQLQDAPKETFWSRFMCLSFYLSVVLAFASQVYLPLQRSAGTYVLWFSELQEFGVVHAA